MSYRHLRLLHPSSGRIAPRSNKQPLLYIQLKSQIELHQWQDRFAASQKRDHDEAIAWLSEIHNSQQIMRGIVETTSADVKALMAFMQNVRSCPW